MGPCSEEADDTISAIQKSIDSEKIRTLETPLEHMARSRTITE